MIIHSVDDVNYNDDNMMMMTTTTMMMMLMIVLYYLGTLYVILTEGFRDDREESTEADVLLGDSDGQGHQVGGLGVQLHGQAVGLALGGRGRRAPAVREHRRRVH